MSYALNVIKIMVTNCHKIEGFPLSFGVFQDYYSRLPQFAGDPYISVIGTVASGVSYLGAPFVIPVIRRYPNYQRQMIWVGCAPQSISNYSEYLR